MLDSYLDIMADTIGIALVDDHLILLDSLDALLSSLPEFAVVAKASSGEEILAALPQHDIDIILMDINMKGKDGIQVLRDLLTLGFTGKCIFLSSYDDLRLVNESMEMGAMGYLTKSSAADCLEEAINKVMNGERYYSPDIRDRIIRAFGKYDTVDAALVNERSALRQLTEREVEVLKLIAMQYTSEEIAKKLYIAKSTIDTHRKNLIHKLKVKNAVGLGLFAERNGLI